MKHVCTLLFSCMMMVAFASISFADDLLCHATVVYEGEKYAVTEDADTQAEAFFELIEEACEHVCRHLPDPEEDLCEKTCERVATIEGEIQCSPKKWAHGRHHK